jgi:hypothetical protein
MGPKNVISALSQSGASFRTSDGPVGVQLVFLISPPFQDHFWMVVQTIRMFEIPRRQGLMQKTREP